jgi:hypothetical protein
MFIRDWRLRLLAITGSVLVVLVSILSAAGVIGDIQTLAQIIQAIPKLAASWWFNPLLTIVGILLIVWAIYGDKRKRRAAASSIVFLHHEEVQVMRSSDGGYERGASDDRAIVLWFENKSKFDYSNVRAWVRYKTRDNKEGELEECDGLWLGEYRRSVDFKAKDKKALVVVIRDRSGKFSMLTNPNECNDANGIPRLLPLDDRDKTHFIKIVLNVDGTPTTPFRCQLKLPPDFDFRCFY